MSSKNGAELTPKGMVLSWPALPQKMNSTVFVGIDSSIVKGGVGIVDVLGKPIRSMTYQTKIGSPDCRVEQIANLAFKIREFLFQNFADWRVALEDSYISNRPGQSKKDSLKKLALSQGAWRAAFFDCNLVLVMPAEWKKAVGLTKYRTLLPAAGKTTAKKKAEAEYKRRKQASRAVGGFLFGTEDGQSTDEIEALFIARWLCNSLKSRRF